jgi:hypothetical protein
MRNIPIRASKFLGSVTSKYRWFAGLYILMSFLILPAVVFGLSMAGRIPFIVVGSIFVVTVAFIVVLNIQARNILSYGSSDRRNFGRKFHVRNISGSQLGFFLCNMFSTTIKATVTTNMDPTTMKGILPAILNPNTTAGKINKDSVYNSLPMISSTSSSPNTSQDSSKNSSIAPSTANSTVDLINRV